MGMALMDRKHRVRAQAGIALAPRLSLLAVLALLWLPVQAQKVYKCEQAGQVSYSQVPCSDGKTERLEIAPGPSDSERHDAQRRAQREKYRAAAIRPVTVQEQRPDRRSINAQQCEQLEARRMQILQQRNSALNRARRGAGVGPNVPADQDVGFLNNILANAEAAMQARGCPLN